MDVALIVYPLKMIRLPKRCLSGAATIKFSRHRQHKLHLRPTFKTAKNDAFRLGRVIEDDYAELRAKYRDYRTSGSC